MRRAAPLAALLLTACAGTEAELPGPLGDARAPRRLSGLEYRRSLTTLLSLDGFAAGQNVPRDFSSDEYALPGAAWTQHQFEKLLDAAEEALDEAFRRGSRVGGAAPLGSCAEDDWTCVRSQLAALQRRAWRRPLRSSEVDHFLAVARALRDDDESFAVAVRSAFAAVLVSTEFLHHVPRTRGFTDGRLTSESLGNRLASVFWSDLPDDTLRSLALDDALDDTTLRATLDRLLSDPRGAAFPTVLAAAWLETGGITSVEKDSIRQPFGGAIRHAMQRETEFLLAHALEQDLPVRALADADFTFADHTLADWYGLDPVASGAGFLRRSLSGTGRRGLLGHGAFLAQNAGPWRTNVPLRGARVLANLLCVDVEPPPANVPQLAVESTSGGSVRDRLSAHATDATCAGCHAAIDPPGFALDAFDGYGRERSTDDVGAPLDTRTEWAGAVVTDAVSFASALAADPRFARCAALSVDALLRGRARDTAVDPPAYDAWSSGPGGLRGLVDAIVMHDDFKGP